MSDVIIQMQQELDAAHREIGKQATTIEQFRNLEAINNVLDSDNEGLKDRLDEAYAQIGALKHAGAALADLVDDGVLNEYAPDSSDTRLMREAIKPSGKRRVLLVGGTMAGEITLEHHDSQDVLRVHGTIINRHHIYVRMMLQISENEWESQYDRFGRELWEFNRTEGP